VEEIRVSPKIDDHDIDTKIRSAANSSMRATS